MAHSRVVFKGNVSHIYSTNPAMLERNANNIAHILQQEITRWPSDEGLNETFAYFWNKEFLKFEQFTHTSDDVILTHSDLYNLIYMTARNPLYSFYLNKYEISTALIGIEIARTFISKLLSTCIGGITYNENPNGIPFYNRVEQLQTLQGLPYADWPDQIKVVTNSFAGPYFWKLEHYSFGLLSNLPKDINGNVISMNEALIKTVPRPTEIELLLSYFDSLGKY